MGLLLFPIITSIAFISIVVERPDEKRTARNALIEMGLKAVGIIAVTAIGAVIYLGIPKLVEGVARDLGGSTTAPAVSPAVVGPRRRLSA